MSLSCCANCRRRDPSVRLWRVGVYLVRLCPGCFAARYERPAPVDVMAKAA